MNTPSKEALEVAGRIGVELFKTAYNMEDFATIIDRHFEPLRQRAERAEARVKELELSLAAIGDIAVANWDDSTVGKVDAILKEPQRYKEKLRELFASSREAAAIRADNAELQKQEAESRRLFYAEQDKRQSAEFRCEELAGALHSAVNELERQTTYRLQKAADAVDAGEPAKQEACGGRCGDPDCNLSTEGELMREPAKHPDSERLEFAFAHDMIVNRRMQSWVKTREQFDAQRGDWEAAARKEVQP